MTFRKLTEEECGQSNPIQQLIEHVTFDHANQEIISHTSPIGCSYDNPINPQTFRVDDLIQEMNTMNNEYQKDLISPTLDSITNLLPDNVSWNEFIQENHQVIQERLYNEWNSNQQDNYYRPYYGLPNPRQLKYLLEPQEMGEFQVQSEQTTNEEFLQKEMEESQKEFMKSSNTIDGKYEVIQSWEHLEKMVQFECEDDEDSEEEIIDSSRSISWDGCSIKYESKKTKNSILDNIHLFSKFEHTYVKKYRNLAEDESTQTHKNKTYEYIVNNDMLDSSTAYEEGESALEDGDIVRSILCFEAAVQQDPKDVNKLSKLCDAWYQYNELHNAWLIADHSLKLAPNNRLALFHKARIYYAQRKNYKSCKYFIEWLRYHELYSDIVPPHFKMEDKTELDDDTLNVIKKMFVKAVQRNSTNPDLEVQACLGMLCHMSKEYEKAADCLGVISKDDPDSRKSIKAQIKMADFLLLADQPLKALHVLYEAMQTERLTSKHKAYCKIGRLLMYVKDYQQAASFLAKGLKGWWDNSLQSAVSDRRFRKHFARLSLCTELLQKTKPQSKISMNFQKTLPEFTKAYYEDYLTLNAVRDGTRSSIT